MKKLILFLALFGTLYGQTTNPPLGVQVTPISPGLEAPAIVTSKFAAEYPNCNPSWKKTGDYFAAEYLDAKTRLKRIIVYDSYGNQIANEQEMITDAYPSQITKYLQKNYPGEKFQVWSRERTAEKTFYTLLKSDTLRFNASGAVIMKKVAPEQSAGKK